MRGEVMSPRNGLGTGLRGEGREEERRRRGRQVAWGRGKVGLNGEV